jgi:hypothetical protein
LPDGFRGDYCDNNNRCKQAALRARRKADLAELLRQADAACQLVTERELSHWRAASWFVPALYGSSPDDPKRSEKWCAWLGSGVAA